MSDVIEIVEEYKTKIIAEEIHFFPNIPRNSLNNNLLSGEEPLVFINAWINRDGILITNKSIYMKDEEYGEYTCKVENISEVSSINEIIGSSLLINNKFKVRFGSLDTETISLVGEMLLKIGYIKGGESISWLNMALGAGIGAFFAGPFGAGLGAFLGAFFKK